MPSPSDLVTVAEAQAYIGQAAANQGVKLGKLITTCSMAILAYINRNAVLPKSYTEVRDGNRNGSIMLRNWPVQSVQAVTAARGAFSGAQDAILPSVNGQCGYLLETADDAPAGAPQSIITPYGGIYAGKDNVTITYTAGYQVSAEAQTVPADGGVVTVAQPYGAWGSDVGVTYVTGMPLRPVAAGAEALGAYSVANGAYTFSAADGGASLLISYGYIPADLANACLEWVQERLAYQDRVGLASKGIAGEMTTYRAAAVPAFVATMLDNYRNPVPIY